MFTDLPVAIGFGIKNANQAAEIARVADAVVVGSAIVQLIGKFAEPTTEIKNSPDLLNSVLSFVGNLSEGVRKARL